MNETTDDQWWKQQDEEQEYETVSLSDRTIVLVGEAMDACEDNVNRACGWLAMDIALKELTIKDREDTIEHLKECIKILERR